MVAFKENYSWIVEIWHIQIFRLVAQTQPCFFGEFFQKHSKKKAFIRIAAPSFFHILVNFCNPRKKKNKKKSLIHYSLQFQLIILTKSANYQWQVWYISKRRRKKKYIYNYTKNYDVSDCFPLGWGFAYPMDW